MPDSLLGSTQGTPDITGGTTEPTTTSPAVSSDTGTQQQTISEPTPIQSSQFNVNSVMDAEGNLKDGWYKEFGEEFQDKQGLEKYKHINSLVKSLTHMESLVGKKFLGYNDMTDEQKVEFKKTMGVPESPEDYGFEKPADNPDYDDSQDKWFAQKAHELGLNKEQAQTLRSEFNQHSLQMLEAQAQSDAQKIIQAEQQLKQEYGEDFNKVLIQANQTAERLGLKQVDADGNVNYLVDANNPETVKVLYKLSEQLGEDKIVNTGKNAGFGLTKTELEDTLAELGRHPALFDKQHPEHNSIVRKRRDIFKKMNPEIVSM